MKLSSRTLRLLLPAVAALLVNCASTVPTKVAASSAPSASSATSASSAIIPGREARDQATPETLEAPAEEAFGTLDEAVLTDDLEEYPAAQIADPLEPFNRATFWCNDKLYLVFFRPVSKGYEKLVPTPLRKGIDNAFLNVKFPVRFVNCVLQGKFKRAGLEAEKFAVNTVGGIGGTIRMSDNIAVLSDIPEEDTGKTFAKWGMGHGAYFVIPFLGPSSVRDGIGLIGDNALNPVNWGVFWGGDHDWTMIPPAANTLRALPSQLEAYDDATGDAIDPYIAVRSAYAQNRDEAVRR